MAEKETPLEAFKRVTGATMRALSEERELTVEFTPDEPQLKGHSARLTTPARSLPANEVQRLRGQADQMALKLRHHDAKTHARILRFAHNCSQLGVRNGSSHRAFKQGALYAATTRRVGNPKGFGDGLDSGLRLPDEQLNIGLKNVTQTCCAHRAAGMGQQHRQGTAEITGIEAGRIFDLPGQEAAPQRAVGHEGNVQFPAGIQDFALGVAAPQRIFRLQRCNRMNGSGTTNGLGASLR